MALCVLASLGGAASAFPTSAMAGEPPEEPITEACSGPFIPGHLCGTLNPGASAKVGYYFEVEEGSSCTGGTHYTDGSEPEGESIPVSTTVSGLTPSTEYAYCLVATNSFGETAGQGLTFMTPSPPPSIESESVSNVTPTNATLEAEINPQSEERGAYYEFQLAKNPADFASEFTCPTEGFPAGSSLCLGVTPQQGALPIRSIPAGTADQSVSLDLESVGTGLEPGTTYYYRVIAARIVPTEDTTQWEEPTIFGVTEEFTTPTVPSILSESATNITQTDATLGAEIKLNEAPAGAYYQFQFATDPGEFASEITCPPEPTSGPLQPCIGTHSPGALPIGFLPGNTLEPSATSHASLDLASAGVTLQPGTTYHYRVLVERRVLTEDTIEWEPPTVFGVDQTFTTPTPIQSCPFSGCPGNPGNGPPAARCKKGHVKRHGKCVKHRCGRKHHRGYKKHRRGSHRSRTCGRRDSASHPR